MALSKQIAAYSDCIERLDQAVDDPQGIRLLFPGEKPAKLFQMRCIRARHITRELSKRIYPREDPKHNATPYDALTIRNPEPAAEDDGTFWVKIERISQPVIQVESLSTGTILDDEDHDETQFVDQPAREG